MTDLEGSLRHASEVLGMRVVEHVDGRAYVTLGSQHNTFADALGREGRCLAWGPGRHGAGDNVATYHTDASGVPIEVFWDMQRIDDEAWQPRTWSFEDYHFINQARVESFSEQNGSQQFARLLRLALVAPETISTARLQSPANEEYQPADPNLEMASRRDAGRHQVQD